MYSKNIRFLRVSKAVSVLLLCCSLHTRAEDVNSLNIRVTLNQENSKLEQVLNEIEHQTNMLFVYNKNVNVDKRVSIQANEASLNEILLDIFGNAVSYKIEGSYIVLSVSDSKMNKQQEKTIQGIVTDINGEPIIGANIIEKGTTNGTITDIDGNFSMPVNTKGSLIVSYIGYTAKEIPIGSVSSYKIVLMEDSEALDEVVVVGYGVQKKASVTGSVASIQSKEINTVKTPNVSNALAGKLPGLRAVQRSGAPGDDNASIDIRGFGSALVKIGRASCRERVLRLV